MTTQVIEPNAWHDSEPRTLHTVKVEEKVERVGFWRGLWNTIKASAIFVATARVVEGVISWFTTGKAGETVSRAGTWIAETASSAWRWTTGLFRRDVVVRTAAAPFHWLSWAGLWTMVGIAGGIAVVGTAANWMVDRWTSRVHRPLVNWTTKHRYEEVHVTDTNPTTQPVNVQGTVTQDDNKVEIQINTTTYRIPPFEPGDNMNMYDWRRLLQVDDEQELARLVYAGDTGTQELLKRIELIVVDNDRADAMRSIFQFVRLVDHNPPKGRRITSEWFGRLYAYTAFIEEGPKAFFNTDEDDGPVQSIQQRAEHFGRRFIVLRNNKDKHYTPWFNKAAFLDGFTEMGKALEARFAPTGTSV